jgi:hypothetical protein
MTPSTTPENYTTLTDVTEVSKPHGGLVLAHKVARTEGSSCQSYRHIFIVLRLVPSTRG